MPQKTPGQEADELLQKMREENDPDVKALRDLNKKVETRRQMGEAAEGSWLSSVPELGKKIQAFSDTPVGAAIARPFGSDIIGRLMSKFSPKAAARAASNLGAESPLDEEAINDQMSFLKALMTMIPTGASMKGLNIAGKQIFPKMVNSNALTGIMSGIAGAEGFAANPDDWSPVARAILGGFGNKITGADKIKQIFALKSGSNSSAMEKIKDLFLAPIIQSLEAGAVDIGGQQFEGDGLKFRMPTGPAITAGLLGGLGRTAAMAGHGSFKQTPTKKTEDLIAGIEEVAGDPSSVGKPILSMPGRKEDDRFLREMIDTGRAEGGRYDVPGMFERDAQGKLSKKAYKFGGLDQEKFSARLKELQDEEFNNKMDEFVMKQFAKPEFREALEKAPLSNWGKEKLMMDLEKQVRSSNASTVRAAVEKDNKLRNQVRDEMLDKYDEGLSKFDEDFTNYKGRLTHDDVRADRDPQTFGMLTKQNRTRRYMAFNKNGAETIISEAEYAKLKPEVRKEFRAIEEVENPYRITDKALNDATARREAGASNVDASNTAWERQYGTNPKFRKIIQDVVSTGRLPKDAPHEVQQRVTNLIKSTADAQSFGKNMVEDPINIRAFNHYFDGDKQMMALGRRQLTRAIVEDISSYRAPKMESDNAVRETIFDKMKRLDPEDFDRLMGKNAHKNLTDLAEAQKKAIEHVTKSGWNPQGKEIAMPLLFLTYAGATGGLWAKEVAAALGFGMVGAIKGSLALSSKHVHVMESIMRSDGKIPKMFRKYWEAPEKHSTLGLELAKLIGNRIKDTEEDDIDSATNAPEKE